MNLFTMFRDLLTRRTNAGAGQLRNKPGGMAWIKGLDSGAEVLNGCIVKTVRLDGARSWAIEPQMPITVTRVHRSVSGGLIWPGGLGTVVAVDDAHLEPIRDAGLQRDEVAELYAPKAPERSAA